MNSIRSKIFLLNSYKITYYIQISLITSWDQVTTINKSKKNSIDRGKLKVIKKYI